MNRTYELITKAGYHITAHSESGKDYLFFCMCDPWDCDGIRSHKNRNTTSEMAVYFRKHAFRYIEENLFEKCSKWSIARKIMLKAIKEIPLLKARISAVEISESIPEINSQQSPTKRGRL